MPKPAAAKTRAHHHHHYHHYRGSRSCNMAKLNQLKKRVRQDRFPILAPCTPRATGGGGARGAGVVGFLLVYHSV